MNLIQLNAATLSTRRCWEITRSTLRVDPRCRQQSLLQQYADELYAQLQVVRGFYDGSSQPIRAHRHKTHAALLAVMTPFLVDAYGNGYRDVASALETRFTPSDLNVLTRVAQARAEFSAATMTRSTEEGLEREADRLERGYEDADLDEDDEIERLDRTLDEGSDIGTDLGSDDEWLFSKGRASRAVDFEGTRGYRTGVETFLRGTGGSGNTPAGTGWLKVWAIDPSGHDRDDVCDDNEAVGPIALGEEFPSGDQTAPAHPNCRCTVYWTRG